jgi:HD-GYP domain-containing protein (c-di-GMP phosphodiesterase class II)
MLGHSPPSRATTRFANSEATDAVRPLFLLAEILESRYSDLRYHGDAVSAYCEMTAEELDLSRRDVDRLALAGALHDIGKVAIEERILRKEEKLTADEWRQIELHPDISANLLFSSDLFDIGRWVRAHHERPDGRGYPRGLSGATIPVEARILAVTDAYDAMRTARVYRAAMSHEQACEELRRGAGSQFDPQVVDAFLRALGRRRRRSRLDAHVNHRGREGQDGDSPSKTGFSHGRSA